MRSRQSLIPARMSRRPHRVRAAAARARYCSGAVIASFIQRAHPGPSLPDDVAAFPAPAVVPSCGSRDGRDVRLGVPGRLTHNEIVLPRPASVPRRGACLFSGPSTDDATRGKAARFGKASGTGVNAYFLFGLFKGLFCEFTNRMSSNVNHLLHPRNTAPLPWRSEFPEPRAARG